jgi:tetratricopeptide (TPR) repeat protein
MIAAFSTSVQTRLRVVYADRTPGRHGPIKLAMLIIKEVAVNEPAGVLAFYEGILRHGEDEFISVIDLADLANHAGNALSRLGRVEESLRMHARACRVICQSSDDVVVVHPKSSSEVFDIYAYGICQQVHRCIALKRTSEALDRVRVLAGLEQIHVNAWVRNRFWEATLIATEPIVDDRTQEALAFVQQALAVSAFLPTEYTLTAHIMLHNRVALCCRKLKRFDEAHDACVLAKGLMHTSQRGGLTEFERERIAWALLEGAYIGCLRKRHADALPFLDELPRVAPLDDSDTDYAAILRCEALIALGKVREATTAIATVGKANETWVLSAAHCVRSQLSWATGDKATARKLARSFIATYPDEKDAIDTLQTILSG